MIKTARLGLKSKLATSHFLRLESYLIVSVTLRLAHLLLQTRLTKDRPVPISLGINFIGYFVSIARTLNTGQRVKLGEQAS